MDHEGNGYGCAWRGRVVVVFGLGVVGGGETDCGGEGATTRGRVWWPTCGAGECRGGADSEGEGEDEDEEYDEEYEEEGPNEEEAAAEAFDEDFLATGEMESVQFL